jgi:hypothetical protein
LCVVQILRSLHFLGLFRMHPRASEPGKCLHIAFEVLVAAGRDGDRTVRLDAYLRPFLRPNCDPGQWLQSLCTGMVGPDFDHVFSTLTNCLRADFSHPLTRGAVGPSFCEFRQTWSVPTVVGGVSLPHFARLPRSSWP